MDQDKVKYVANLARIGISEDEAERFGMEAGAEVKKLRARGSRNLPYRFVPARAEFRKS